MTFLSPALLLALLALPLLWWLLRLTPPRPKREIFPPTKILLDLKREEETPQNTPLWLLLLRLSLALALILGLASPLFNRAQPLTNANAPVILLLDNGVNAAKNFETIITKAMSFIRDAENNGQGVVILTTALKREIILNTPQEARNLLLTIKPQGFLPARADILPTLQEAKVKYKDASLVFLSDGYASLNDHGFTPDIAVQGGLKPLITIHEVSPSARGFNLTLVSSQKGEVMLNAVDEKSLSLAAQSVNLNVKTTLDLPIELRNQVTRLEVVGERNAGAVFLVDRRLRKKIATLISGASSDISQALLSPTYYLERALEPFIERRVVSGSSPSLAVLNAVADKIPLIILTDVGNLTDEAARALSNHVNDGAVLVRFAGSRLAGNRQDNLLPVKLRQDVRQMGGSLSWDKPRGLGAFSPKSPFKDLTPNKEVKIYRQVLAEPDGFLSDKTWVSLEDGTPIVTAEQRGRGQIVLFHITANLAWSDLPLSGLFLDMMERLAQMSGTSEKALEVENGLMPPLQILDGFGVLLPAPATVEAAKSPLPKFATSANPAGFYGEKSSPLAINIFAPEQKLSTVTFQGKSMSYLDETALDLRPILLKIAFALLMLDCLIMLWLGGHLRKLKFLAILPLLFLSPVEAQQKGEDETRLAFVKTGKMELDRVTERGLIGLTTFITARTTLEPSPPKAIDLERDELNIYPILYWVVEADTPNTSAQAKVKLDNYLKNGGMLLVDTRDANLGANIHNAGLKRVLQSLDIPELSPLPKDHVLGRSYYLLDSITGRFNNGVTWVESLNTQPDDERPAKASDGVSPIIITNNDLAAAWAIDDAGKALLPVDGVRGRDFAYRSGVNIVFYALTGNYKADQVHAPALLERLGRNK